MSVVVLQAKSQINEARFELRNRGLSCTDTKLQTFMRKLRLNRSLKVGDNIKSWDVLRTAQFIEKNVSINAEILDIGAYASEILCILHRIGYSHLTGVDLNPDISRMPYADRIRYIVSDFMHTPFDNESFDAITSTSVIEHGFNSTALLTEVSRLLRPNGYFIASVDYWPDKINTDGLEVFGLSWHIFSKDELLAFFRDSKKFGFSSLEDINLSAYDPVISWQGKRYTFSWFAMQKKC